MSRQGEGRLTETPSVFVRTSGCNLRCRFCDTPFTSWKPAGVPTSVAQILQQVNEAALQSLPQRQGEADPFAAPAKHVVLTGGEPMLAKEIVSLCDSLSAAGYHLTIETAGTLDRELQCDLMSISPKLSNSTPSAERAGQWATKHEAARNRPDVAASLIRRHDYQLKFVVCERVDVAEIESWLTKIGPVDREKVLLMPEGTEAVALSRVADWLVPLCEQRGFTFCPRKHIQWYGNLRAT